jgi:hypothetical protein
MRKKCRIPNTKHQSGATISPFLRACVIRNQGISQNDLINMVVSKFNLTRDNSRAHINMNVRQNFLLEKKVKGERFLFLYI